MDMRLFILMLATFFTGSALCAAKTLEGSSFSPTHQAAGEQLQLAGLGTAKYLLWKVSVGGVYLPGGTPVNKILENVPKRLEMSYLVDIEKDKLVASAEHFLKKNFTEAELERQAENIKAIHAVSRTVKKGTRCSLTYVPGSGMELAYDGKVAGTFRDPEFAKMYFSIWFGKKPCCPSMKSQIRKGL